MTLLWRTGWLRFLAAALLPLVPSGTSKVICVSPTGHSAVEDASSQCCAPRACFPDVAFTDSEPCEGCTDYPATPTIEIRHSQPEISHASDRAESGPALTAPVQQNAVPAMYSVPGFDRPIDSAVFTPSAVSLRC